MTPRLNTFCKCLFLACLLTTSPASADEISRRMAPATVKALSPILHEGDIVFVSIPYYVLKQVARTTGSWESHVGVLFRTPKGEWEIAESTVPISRFTSFQSFLKRTDHGQFSVMRLKRKLTPKDVIALRREADKRMGKFYSLGFNQDSHNLFCSKFVYEIYRDALGIKIGRQQTFRDLFDENSDAPVSFWKLWFGGKIPWDRKTITTTSLYRSPLLKPVAENLPPEWFPLPPKR